MLEVIDKGSATESHPVPLLFVHGAWHAAWCWDEHFLDFFAERGFRAVAISLRGYGASDVSKPLNSVTVADYVDDVRSTVKTLGSEPVLIGHSLGGLVVQKYLDEGGHALAGVLLASYPAQRLRRAAVALRTASAHPWITIRANAGGTTADLMNTPRRAREALFCADTPESTVESCAARMQQVSRGANGVLVRVRPSQVTTPMLVLGATCDSTIRVKEVDATARAYGTDAEYFPNMGHDMMLEPRWQAVAERIDGWLTTRRL
jgi:pimeloyl-ACP methyl ester carboxylesterase